MKTATVGDVVSNRAIAVGTDEQRRIAALEVKVNQLNTRLSLLQSALTVPSDTDDKLKIILDSAVSSKQFEELV